MSHTLLQIDFPMSGPWGDEMTAAFGDLAHDIAGEAGLVWKVWTENAETGRGGGIYVFETTEAAQAYLEKHSKRLEGFGITGIEAKLFQVNHDLSAITRASL
ncbi:monooxygenase [Lutimaribacter saemankumensis]|uniref:Putative mono-oxygenase ydhR n=1 Tax=Lutimaribacter saemankumensis TaxID=490829 RepID=A0A1G8P127_9RHOB|nr:monooxygenase [Lutimaribacter saemankumensis]SDI85948.1 Putative mono-oxygenase ydhR [Lutimaribacter saemankumensis]